MSAKPQFWENARQAEERLVGSTILYEGKPVYVSEVRETDPPDLPPILVAEEAGKGRKRVAMDEEGFGKFRILPITGWVNSSVTGAPTACYLSRYARRTRQHGLSEANTRLYTFRDGGSLSVSRSVSPGTFLRSEDYLEAHEEGAYPSLEEILLNIQEDSCLAYSSTFAVYRCPDGVRWLYRKRNRIGMFVGVTTLSLFPRLGFYREEIMSDPLFTIDNIQEF